MTIPVVQRQDEEVSQRLDVRRLGGETGNDEGSDAGVDGVPEGVVLAAGDRREGVAPGSEVDAAVLGGAGPVGWLRRLLEEGAVQAGAGLEHSLDSLQEVLHRQKLLILRPGN